MCRVYANYQKLRPVCAELIVRGDKAYDVTSAPESYLRVDFIISRNPRAIIYSRIVADVSSLFFFFIYLSDSK